MIQIAFGFALGVVATMLICLGAFLWAFKDSFNWFK